MRVLFIGTGDIGLPSLEWLLNTSKHEVVGVVTQPDKPVGRKQVLTPPQIKVRALAAGIQVIQPPKLRHAVEELKAFNADVAIVIAYGQILSRAVLEVPPLGCLNVHTSLLPRHRGAAPIQAAIRDGDAETGVTIMFMDEGLDTGDILLMKRLPIADDDTGGTLHDKLAIQAPAALEEALDLLATGHPPREKQDDSKATHVRKLTRQDGRIDWSRPAIELDRLVRAFTPWPGTSCMLKDTQMKIHRAQLIPNADACPPPGTIVSADASGIVVSCGNGLLSLLEVQIEGGRRLSAADFLRGHPLQTGDLLL
ncbi:MAG: methionyl-tRNA formyltransferase [Prosthecobacter sp.]|jgi:methionyl-tRNA formyltransferase|uniref:methionyl-tRNA formyltransferase n=1 Tax=Prosthecobacter sp. TaxID=1965333 RepID=UPI0019DF92C3|nr:methionyl-tRNA formyltransferase [Prosthecobacter sp.]MBE2282032.1 methionyl-tRNA formyltransferase [Prosthecobacter sp.]